MGLDLARVGWPLLLPRQLGRGFEMQVTQFVIRTALLVLPGVLASKVYRKLRGRTDKKHWEDFLEILVFSIASYTICAAGIGSYSFLVRTETEATSDGAVGQPKRNHPVWTHISSLDALSNEDQPLIWTEILAASGIGLGLAILAGYIHNFSLINRFGQLIHATKRMSDEDIWQTFCDTCEVPWVFVRDHQLNLVYYGFMRYYSDSGRGRELILENVDVFTNDEGEELYSAATMYVSRPSHQLTIEVPAGLDKNDTIRDDSIRERKNEEK